ncbi:MAG: hypothetical protein DI584_01280 [Stenotrophomonas sp.]|nr:MAG: hypothetical protein DI584_01280 [Stenotrophomonas sp.]
MSANRLRQAVYPLLRTLFRALPLSEGQRDKLRGHLMGQLGHWVPQPALGRQTETPGLQLRWRADEAAIGYTAQQLLPLPAASPATLIAFYLPQFHTFAENDAWWGKGFTEWRNVTRALPQFQGHVQPRLPADLGFYDLRNPQVMRDQAKLAADYGIGAFCFYYYWFSGRSLMETPLQQWLADDSIDLPFCLCWANENWARRWDGRDDDILIGQQHSDDDDLAFIAHIAPYLRDRRALKVDGLPMLLVYRPNLLPDAAATAQRWRQWCRDNDIGEIHLAYVQGFERPDPRDIGFDAAVEFPPNMSNPRSLSAEQWLLNPEFNGDVRDWRELAKQAAARPMPEYTLYPGVNPGWDNEARRSGRGRVYLHASPRGYLDWLRQTIHVRLAPIAQKQKFVFINAWNEWAEGAVLEPDARLGHAWLWATRQALEAAPTPPTRPCIVIHAWYLDALEELLEVIGRSGLDARIVITTTAEKAVGVRDLLGKHNLDQRGEVTVFENRGRDILPFLHVADRLLNEGEELVLKLHTKRSTHLENGDQWRREMVGALLANHAAPRIVDAFRTNPKLGLVAPAGHLLPVAGFIGGNGPLLSHLQVRLGLVDSIKDQMFASGSMYWVRLQALRPLLDAHLYPSEFEPERGQIDATLAHAVERVTGAATDAMGLQIRDTSQMGATGAPTPSEYAYANRS